MDFNTRKLFSICHSIWYDDQEFAIAITKQIIEFSSQVRFNFSFDTYIVNVIQILFDKYFESTWDYFGEGIIGDHLTFSHLEHMIGSRNGYLDEREGIAFHHHEHNGIILEWCRKHPEIAPERITHMMPLSIKDKKDIKWHPFSLKRQWGFSYILTKKGISRASSDVGFMFIAYNLRRIVNILTHDRLKE
ncbi:MAG: hypothetical protein MUO72_15160, partial [Bacteroidales bacterium]|nr:hypothetical protein [Bacteroidales bacterium]